MTGTVNGLCYRRKRMTGRAAAGVVEEKPCSSGTESPAAVPANLPGKRVLASFHLDYYTQARKALSERSPFDSDEVMANTVATLPSGLAGLVLKHTDSRKKHKKSHSDSKASKKGSVEKNKSSSVWTEVEECFRELTVPDIDKLFQLSVSVDNLGRDSYFRVPVPGSLLSSNKLEVEVAEVKEKLEVRNDIRDPANVAKEEPNGDCAEVGSGVEAMDVDAEAAQRNGLPSEGDEQSNDTLQPTDRQGMGVQLLSGVEWVLGSRSKILLSTTRPSKKRKLLGENAGLQRLIVAHPCEGKSNICHFCSMGDTGDQLNRLVLCSACKMAAHQKCYGIQRDVNLSWMCSWCTWSRHREATHLLNKGTGGDRPCVLCPKSGGALKPLHRDGGGNGSSVNFAHLFCSEWMPEVYVEDMRIMEPILNVDKINETRWKLICNLCKTRHGTCIRCTDGACRVSFHPACAREAGHRLEMWGKFGCDDVELRAYCFKHSDLPNGGGAIQQGQQDFAIVSALLPSIPSLHLNKPSEDELIRKSRDRIAVSVRSSHASSDKLEDGGLPETLLQDTADSVEHTFEHKINIELRDVENMVERTAEGACTPECINLSPDIKKVEVDPVETEGPLAAHPISSINSARPLKSCDLQHVVSEGSHPLKPNGSFEITELEASPCSSLNICNDKDIIANSTSGFIPSKKMKVEEMLGQVMRREGYGCDGGTDLNDSSQERSPDAGPSFAVVVDQYNKAKDNGMSFSCPDGEVEGELIYFQNKLLYSAIWRKHFVDDLICKIVQKLPQEMEVVCKQRWDDVHVNQYLYELREARKQGRKERRHMEAQAVLAAATAVAAASSRISSLRKDEESSHQEINQTATESSRGHGGVFSRLRPHVKEGTSNLASVSATSDKHSDLTSVFSKEHPKSCDVCKRQETLLNPILICAGCKVAVHLDCYRCVMEYTGPWYCELCEEASTSRVPFVSSWERSHPVAECGLCGAANGAFRKSTTRQWVHAFCAEWVLDSTFKRGQVNPIEGMEKVVMGNDVCSVCHNKSGVCIKCNYGNCQGTFHPSCGRAADYYMIAKNVAGKLQHRAYCEKHSIEQKAKAETQKPGAEEIRNIKRVRVELEKLRLLCERIVKREKLKRELVVCSHDVLASKRDSMAFSMLVRTPFLPAEVSSESATTSVNGHGDGSQSSGSRALQKSDDATVDTRLSFRRRIKLPVSNDTEQKTDDSSTSQHLPTLKPMDRVTFGGKQIPYRASLANRNIPEGGEIQLKSRKLHMETVEKELIMTSDQASMKNRRLPKGYIYVPVDRLSNEKAIVEDSVGNGDRDG
ncbi:hypothetical protein Droror1_Dr00027833 [Drosera rotundifolia]